MKKIDIDNWYRKDYFLFYKSFHCPLFNLSMELDGTKAFHYCKQNGISFFIFCLYAFLKAAQNVPQFRYRLIDDKVFDMETLNATTPIMRENDENHQFTMIDCPYLPTLSEFHANVKQQMENAAAGIPPAGAKEQNTNGLICLNYVPFFSFNGGSLPTLETHQSMPIMNWGRLKERDGQLILPYFMQANHMFIDGYHIGQFVQCLEEYFSNPDKI